MEDGVHGGWSEAAEEASRRGTVCSAPLVGMNWYEIYTWESSIDALLLLVTYTILTLKLNHKC